MRMLLEQGADFNRADKYGDYASHHAAKFHDDPEILKELLDAGIDKDLKSTKLKGTALHLAAETEHHKAMKYSSMPVLMPILPAGT